MEEKLSKHQAKIKDKVFASNVEKYCPNHDPLSFTIKNRRVLEVFFNTGSIYDAGKAANISSEKVNQILCRLEVDTGKVQGDVLRSQKEEAYQEWDEIIQSEKITTVKQFAKRSNMNPTEASLYLKKHSLRLYPKIASTLVGKELGLWLILKQEDKVGCYCRCQGCGIEKAVQRRYLLEGKSLACRKCAAKRRDLKQELWAALASPDLKARLDKAIEGTMHIKNASGDLAKYISGIKLDLVLLIQQGSIDEAVEKIEKLELFGPDSKHRLDMIFQDAEYIQYTYGDPEEFEKSLTINLSLLIQQGKIDEAFQEIKEIELDRDKYQLMHGIHYDIRVRERINKLIFERCIERAKRSKKPFRGILLRDNEAFWEVVIRSKLINSSNSSDILIDPHHEMRRFGKAKTFSKQISLIFHLGKDGAINVINGPQGYEEMSLYIHSLQHLIDSFLDNSNDIEIQDV
ncbi:MAG: hypothetical protein KME14_05405 [Tildeniella torsiva UHER 1998/13D]|jgi:tetratricopeptide (TPR) repeat protein|nr:hypothetical protein [Tildeniella torsiva UHER 1998/13D]